jgi:two-component system response regulator PilR (NtrC family)
VNDKDGLFRVADGGTIFLDEIGELPLGMQVKLLRVLQDRTFRPVGGTENITVDVRVVCATNRNLEEEVAKGKFREDLYYRLNVILIKTPTLRERKDDIPELVTHFLRKFSLGIGKSVSSISKQALDAVLSYDFPGNIRELENMMERAVALEGTAEITLESLTPAVQAAYQAKGTRTTPMKADSTDSKKPAQAMAASDRHSLFRQAALALDTGKVNLDEIVADLEKEFVLKALEKTGGVKKKAAEVLGITFRSIRYRIEKLGIEDTESEEK